MSTADKERKKELKVYVKMHDGTHLLGLFYLSETERLQDVMNDDRRFLPLHVFYEKGNKTQTVMLAKRFIEQVEEFDPMKNKPNLQAPPPAQPASASVVQKRPLDLSELSLDDAHFKIKRE